jgi:hypothetical protein
MSHCSQRCQRVGGRGSSARAVRRIQAEGKAVEADIVDPTKGCLVADNRATMGWSVDIGGHRGSAVGCRTREAAAAAGHRMGLAEAACTAVEVDCHLPI